jgi:large subunit ribosomal protein L35
MGWSLRWQVGANICTRQCKQLKSHRLSNFPGALLSCDYGFRKKRQKGLAMPRNRSKPKKKLKTHRGAAKRFKVTATGKILRMHSGKRHLMGTKAPKRMRKLKKITQVNKADKLKTMQMLPYGL